MPGKKTDLKNTEYFFNWLEKNKGSKKIPYFDLGVSEYQSTFELQKKIFDLVLTNYFPGVMLLLEHPPVITLGNNMNRSNLLSDDENLKRQSIDLVQSNRGGDITFHGPGQLVCYPIFNLSYFGKDLNDFVYRLEQVVIDVLKEYKIKSTRIDKLRGVFIDNRKIASVGIHVKKWITLHGFSFNINVDLGYFKNITACGLKDYNQVSLETILQKNIPVSIVKEQVLKNSARIFGITFLGLC